VPEFNFLKDWCARKDIPFTSREEVVNDPRVKERIMREVEAANAGLGQWERIKRIALLPREFSIDAGELTPTLKLRRKPILARYAREVEALYAEG